MRFVAEPISDLRLKRFHRWAMLWLKWFVAFLDGAEILAPLSKQAQIIGHSWLDRIERGLMAIVMLRAVRCVRPCQPRRGVAELARKESGLSRAVVGSSLRRALHSNDLRQRIERLTQDINTLVMRLLRRLPRGLTRRRAIKARREARLVQLRDACALLQSATDTS